MTNKYKRLIKDSFIFSIGSLGSKAIMFLLVPLYTHYLTSSEYGTADLVFTIAQLVIPVVTITIYNGVVRYGLSQKYQQNDVFKSGLLVTIVGCLCSIALTPFFSFYDAISPWKWLLCAYICANALYTLFLNFLKVIDKNKVYAAISIINTFILALLNFILIAKYNQGVTGYIFSNIVAVSFSTILAMCFCNVFQRIKSGKLDKNLLCLMAQYSVPIVINDIGWWIIYSSNKVMIELMIGVSALGLYTVATKIPSLINVFISIFSQSWGISSIKEIESTNDTVFYSTVFRYYTTLVCVVTIAAILVIKPFMKIYVGVEYFDSWKYVPLLLASATFAAISSFFGTLYGALKINVHAMVTTIIAALTNILINYVGIKMFGIWGAVLGSVCAYVVIAHLRFLDVLRYIKLQINWLKYVTNAFFVLLIAVITSFAEEGVLYCIPLCIFILIFNRDFFTKKRR